MSVDGSQTNSDAGASTERKPITVDGPDLFKKPPELKRLGGSQSDHWNNQIANQTIDTLRIAKTKEGTASAETKAAIVGLCGIDPKDELEGMIAAQLIAGHNAAMECYRRAMLPDQVFEYRRENLNQAGKLSRTFATLLEALNRHRGKGQQKVVVEHVHVHRGGQAIVGNVEIPGVGLQKNWRINPMQSKLPMHRSPRCGARIRSGKACQSPSMPNGRCRMHGGLSPGAPKGNKNAFKHGHYTAEAVANRRAFSKLLRTMKAATRPH